MIIQLFIVVLLIPFLPLLNTYCWHWWEACIYAVLFTLAFGVSRWLESSGILRHRTPDEQPDQGRREDRQSGADCRPGYFFWGRSVSLPEYQCAGGETGVHKKRDQQTALGPLIDQGDDE